MNWLHSRYETQYEYDTKLRKLNGYYNYLRESSINQIWLLTFIAHAALNLGGFPDWLFNLNAEFWEGMLAATVAAAGFSPPDVVPFRRNTDRSWNQKWSMVKFEFRQVMFRLSNCRFFTIVKHQSFGIFLGNFALWAINRVKSLTPWGIWRWRWNCRQIGRVWSIWTSRFSCRCSRIYAHVPCGTAVIGDIFGVFLLSSAELLTFSGLPTWQNDCVAQGISRRI